MPDLIVNTGPVIALTAAFDTLSFLDHIYSGVLIPQEVYLELRAGGDTCPELAAIHTARCIQIASQPVTIQPYLQAQLDKGEASVIQTAMLLGSPPVAIDETLGRQIARLHQLRVTGSVGILVKAHRLGFIGDLNACFQRMRDNGVWISQSIIDAALDNLA